MAWIDADPIPSLRPGMVVDTTLPTCKWNGKAHRYICIVPDPDRPVLACECGDVLWKERPKDA